MSYPNNKEDLVKLYKKRLEENLDMEAKMKDTQKEHDDLSKQADKTDEHLKMVQNTGQHIAELLKSFPDDKYIVKTQKDYEYASYYNQIYVFLLNDHIIE